LEALPDAWAENRPSDYALELARVTEDLTAAASQLDDINKHPAFRMTLEQHQAAIANAGNELMREAAGKLDDRSNAIQGWRLPNRGLVLPSRPALAAAFKAARTGRFGPAVMMVAMSSTGAPVVWVIGDLRSVMMTSSARL
jgi:hypothetical protein